MIKGALRFIPLIWHWKWLMESISRRRGPLLALSRLTGATGIWPGGCLGVCTLNSCLPPLLALQWPHAAPFSLKQGTMQAPPKPLGPLPNNLCPCATSRGVPCTKIPSLAHLAHSSWPPRRLVMVFNHCLDVTVITSNHASVDLNDTLLPLETAETNKTVIEELQVVEQKKRAQNVLF